MAQNRFSLYNGNIAAVAVSLEGTAPQVMSYGYDPLNRLRSTRAWQFSVGWSQHPGAIFAEAFSYDPTGNATTKGRG